MKIFLLFTIAFLAYAQAAEKCPESRKAGADSCGKQMFFLMDPAFVHQTEDNLPAYCAKVDKNIKCVQDYGKDCLKGFSRQTITIGLHGMKKHYKTICGSEAKLKKEFLQNTEWIDKEKNAELYTCASASISNMIHIAEKVRSNEQIPQACCSYWLARRCITKKLKSFVDDKKRTFLESMIDNSMTGLIEFLCSKQDSIATCKKAMPEAMSRMDDVFKKVKKNDKNAKESYLIPFLDVISEDKP